MESLFLPLRLPPHISRMGLRVHGHQRREHYRMSRVFGLHFYQYRGAVDIAGTQVPFEPGSLSVTPRNIDLVWTFPRRAPHYFAHLLFPEHDASHLVEVPVITRDLGTARRAALVADFEQAIRDFQHEPVRVSAWVWNLLWSLVPGQAQAREAAVSSPPHPFADDEARLHPAVRQVLATIERGLDQPLALAALADQVDLSREHLIRLFQRQCGASVMAYVRRRRMERARELLVGSTLPVQAIARAVGIADLHRFNKMVNRQWGAAPSRLRGR